MPYLTNDERIRLGLQHFGSDVPAHEIAAAEQEYRERQKAEEAGEAQVTHFDPEAEQQARQEPEPAPAKRKRAHKERGHFKEDDPTTPDKNEAWEDA